MINRYRGAEMHKIAVEGGDQSFWDLLWEGPGQGGVHILIISDEKTAVYGMPRKGCPRLV